MDLVQILLSNLSIIFLMHICLSGLQPRFLHISKPIFHSTQILIFSVATIILFYIPIQIGEFLFDLRLIPLLFLAFTHGWRISVPVIVIVSLWRFGIGGSAALPSVLFNIIMPTALGLLLTHVKIDRYRYLKLFIILSFIWSLVTVFLKMNIDPNGWQSFKEIAFFHYLSVILGFFALYSLYLEKMNQLDTQSKIEHMAYHDPLTDLPNRTLFHMNLTKAIDSARKNEEELGILFLDLDRFKSINDTFGHSIGDLLLKQASIRLKNCITQYDMVSRQGGDEFIILLRSSSHETRAEIAKKIISVMNSPFELSGNEIYISPSIGISSYPSHGDHPDTLLKKADTAMYVAKEKGKNIYQFYTDELEQCSNRKFMLEKNLRKAIQNNELQVNYQPQINIVTNQIVGMEALLRWNHPVLGQISPSEFIPVAEDTGLIVSIGEWVLRTACNQNKRWQEQGFATIPVSVNLSPRQFLKEDLVSAVQQILKESKLDPVYLNLEITESVAVGNFEKALTKLNQLKSLGVEISLDDFGTGFSSLNYIKWFPINVLKIDQSFIRGVINDPQDAAIVRAIINVANCLHLTVLAEGVETEEQVRFLQLEKCEEAQGYYYSEPLEVNDFENLLKNRITSLSKPNRL